MSRRLEDDRAAYQVSLEHRNRAIVEERDNGMSLGSLAQLTGLDKSRIVQIIASWGGEN